MKAENFCYWLQGFFELKTNPGPIDEMQSEIIRRHLELVFFHDIDPKQGNKEHQKQLNQIHNGGANGAPKQYRC